VHAASAPHGDADEQAVALYALGLLDGGEREAFELHLAGCARCQQVLAQDRETIAELDDALPAVRPPPAFRARMLRLVDTELQGRDVVATPAERAHRQIRTYAWAALRALAIPAAAAIVVLIAGFLIGQRYAGSQVLVSAPLQAASAGGSATVLVHADGVAELELRGLPDPAPGRIYQAWAVVDATGQRLPAGMYDDGNGVFRLDQPALGRIFELTEESAPGSDAPTTRPLFTGRVGQ
jgi:anti-sigma-K factor RskA